MIMAQGWSAGDPESTLTFGIKVELFTALKASIFARTRHASLAHLFGERLGRLPLQGPQGTGAEIEVALSNPDDSNSGSGVDYACWKVTAATGVRPNHPEWFTDCAKPPLVSLREQQPPRRFS